MRYLVILILFLSCSCEKKQNEHKKNLLIENSLVEVINVFEEEKENIPWDEFVEKVEIVSLETSNNALFHHVSSIYVDENIYVFSMPNDVSVFSNKGKFLHKVGRKGRGPGEYQIIYDFQVDSVKNVYLTDIGNIRKYDSIGNWKLDINLKSIEGNFNYIDASCVFDINNFYVWKNEEIGSSNKPKNAFFLYQVKNQKEIIGKEFKTIADSPLTIPRFTKSTNGYYLSPPWYDNKIYLITKKSIDLKYLIDFGNKELDADFISTIGERSLSVNREMAKGKCFGIRNFWNQKDYLFFNFTNYEGKLAFSLYDKQNKKVYTSGYKGSHLYNIPILMRCFEKNKKSIIASAEPYAIKNMKTTLNQKLLNLMSLKDIDKVKNMKETDNTIIIKLILK